MSARRRSLITILAAIFMLVVGVTSAAVATSPTKLSPTAAHLVPASNLVSSSSTTPAGKHPTITISSFVFTVPRHVAPGATVKITNMDGFAHTVTADGGAFDVPAPGKTTVKFTAPATVGRYPFHCSIHPTMTAVLKVR